MKEQIFQLSAIAKALIKPSDEKELEPIYNTIEIMNNRALLSSEELDKTLREMAKDKKEISVDQTNESNRTARNVKEKKLAEAMKE